MLATQRQLIIRDMPFDLERALATETLTELTRDFGVAKILGSLAISVITEFFELYLTTASRTFGLFDSDDHSRTFQKQELRHSSALHALNTRFINGTYSRTRVGRASDIARRVFANELERLDLVERDPSTLPEFKRFVCHFASVIELIVSIPLALADFSELERDTRGLRLKHAPFFYVMLYHSAEEAEHGHVTWEYTRSQFGFDVLSGDAVAETKRLFDRFLNDQAVAMRLLATHLGLTVTDHEIDTLASRVALRSHLDRLLSRGPGDDLFASLREECTDSWDLRWEPIFRRRVMEKIAHSPGNA